MIGVVSGGLEAVVAEALAPGVQRTGDPDVEVGAGTCRSDLDHPSVADRDAIVVVIDAELHQRIPLASGDPELRVGIDEGGERPRIEPLRRRLRGGGNARRHPRPRRPLRERHREPDGAAAGAQHDVLRFTLIRLLLRQLHRVVREPRATSAPGCARRALPACTRMYCTLSSGYVHQGTSSCRTDAENRHLDAHA